MRERRPLRRVIDRVLSGPCDITTDGREYLECGHDLLILRNVYARTGPQRRRCPLCLPSTAATSSDGGTP